MSTPSKSSIPWRLIGSLLLVAGVLGGAYALYRWKQSSRSAAAAAAAAMPEPAEAVAAALVTTRPYTRTTTAIGTVRALRSITLRNELPGTVRSTTLETGVVVEKGTLLVELDVAVEQAELAALRAESRLAETMLGRMRRALEQQGASAADVDRAQAQQDMALAKVRRLEALIEQKRLRAPFRARVGLVNLHVGQYLEPGTQITTLQGMDESVHIDFAVTQEVATRLAKGVPIQVITAPDQAAVEAKIVAIDARVDVDTRNTWIRAELRSGGTLPQPGASVRVRVPVAETKDVMVVPVTALRRSPGGNSVFVLRPDESGKLRSFLRPVRSGTLLGNHVIVHSGVEPGDQVASTGSFKLREGALVQVAETATAPGKDPKQN